MNLNRSGNAQIELRLEGMDAHFLRDSDDEDTRQFPIGTLARIRDVMHPGHVTASGMESAIAEIEDLIMPVLRNVGPAPHLRVSGPELERVMGILGSEDKGEGVPISAVESLFNRVADIASGAPVGQWQVATDPDFALGLILLREVMHHGGFAAVSTR